MGKRCSTCHRWVPRSGYNRRAGAPDGLQPRCRDCCRAWYADHREQHKRNVATRNRRVRDEHGQRLVEYLAEHPCVD